MLDRMKRILTHWLPVFLWAGLIFFLSSIPSLESGFSLTWDVLLRKLAHAGEFGLLAILVARALGTMSVRTVLIAGLLGVFYAATDEYHQTFVAGREGTPWDVLVDGLGVLIGLALWWEFGRMRSRSRSKFC